MKKQFILSKRIIIMIIISVTVMLLYCVYALYVAFEDIAYKPQNKTTVIKMKEDHGKVEYQPRDERESYATSTHSYYFLVNNPRSAEWDSFKLGLEVYKQNLPSQAKDQVAVWLGREGKVYYGDTPEYSNFPFYEAIITRNFKPFAVYGARERYKDADLWNPVEGAVPDTIIKIDDNGNYASCYRDFTFETYRSVLDFEWKIPEKLKPFLQRRYPGDDPGIRRYGCGYKVKDCNPNASDAPPDWLLPCNGLNEMDVDSSNIVMQ